MGAALTHELHSFMRTCWVCWLSSRRVDIWTMLSKSEADCYYLLFYFRLIFLAFIFYLLILIVLLFSTSFSIYVSFYTYFCPKSILLMNGPDDISLILKCFNKWVWELVELIPYPLQYSVFYTSFVLRAKTLSLVIIYTHIFLEMHALPTVFSRPVTKTWTHNYLSHLLDWMVEKSIYHYRNEN